jgi:hypothetical protein
MLLYLTLVAVAVVLQEALERVGNVMEVTVVLELLLFVT